MANQGGLLKRAGKVILILLLAVAGFFYCQKSCWAVDHIVISEIQIDSEKGASDEFIELYNPNNENISLKLWSIQKATPSGAISKKNFREGDIIPAKGYFLIVNSYASQQLLSLADMAHNSFSIASGNTIFLVAAKDYIVSGKEESIKDKVGFGMNRATLGIPFSPETDIALAPSSGQSLGRKWLEITNEYQDTDNNREDFEIQSCPNPKAQPGICQIENDNQQNNENNISTSTPPAPPAESDEGNANEIITPSPAQAVYKLGDVVINELVSDPADEEVEWVELYNATSKEIDLSGWTIEEGSGAKTNLSGILAGSGKDKFFVAEKPKGNLNNGGDIIILRATGGVLIDQVAYGNWDDGNLANNAPATSDPDSLARKFDGQNSFNNLNDFAVTATPTKGTSNIIIKEGIEGEEGGEGSYDYSDDIIISEIFPNPVGSDNEAEFIELYNKGEAEINLLGWGLGDDSKGKYKFKDKVFIKAGQYLAVPRSESKIALNNGGDKVKLYPPLKDEPASIIEYKEAIEGWSYNLEIPAEAGQKNKYVWSEVSTPGKANIIKTINHPPVVSFSCPEEIVAGQPILFDSSDTVDEDGDELKYSWDFGDGINLTLASPQHTYLKEGNYLAKLAVSDGENKVEKEEIVKVVSSAGNASSPASIIINEILPDPEGADAEGEWIELKNTGIDKVNLLNWQLDDNEGGSKPYKINSDLWLGVGDFYLAERNETGLALNNSNESVRLFNNSGEMIDEVEYAKAFVGESYARAENNKWFWTTVLTPGEENIISVSGSKSNEQTKVSGAIAKLPKSAVAGYIPATLEKIKELEPGDLVRVGGTVAVEPGILGAQYFYIVGSPGIQVYNYKKEFPDLKIGDYIEISGELAVSNGEQRIKTKQKEDIKIIEHRPAPKPEELAVEKITEEYLGNFVSITGQVVDKKGSIIYVDDGTEEIRVYIKEATGINVKEIKEGETLAIAGIVSRTESGLRIMPRSADDIIKKDSESQGQAGQVLGEVAASDEWKIAARDKKLELFKYLLVLAGGVIVVLGGLLIKELRENKDK